MSASPSKKRNVARHRAGKLEGRSSENGQTDRRSRQSLGAGSRRWGTLLSNHVEWVVLGLVLLFIVAVRARLLAFPLERDEGEYAYLGQLIQQGFPPYSLAYNMKFPGTYFMYALIMSMFGQNVTAIHLGLMIVNCATVLLVYKVSAKIVSSLAGVVAACSYAFLSLSPSVLGFAGHATHFVVFWALAGFLTLLYAMEKNSWRLYFLAGALLSIALIMKQPGFFFTLFGAAAIATHLVQQRTLTWNRIWRSFGPFISGVLAPLLVMVVYLYAAGVFDKFWFFTIIYSSKYASQVPLSVAPNVFMASFPGVVDGFFLIWLFGALGLVCFFLHPRLKDKRLSLSLFTICSFLTVCPGFYFRAHYFVTLLPAVSLLAAVFVDYLYAGSTRLLSQRLPASGRAVSMCITVLAFATALLVGIVQQRDYMFVEEPEALCRRFYGANPFPESLEVARFIEHHTVATDRIAVIGSEPQIYFYSDRHSATGYIYTYSLMEAHSYSLTMQKEMAAQIERSNPKFIVFVWVAASWLAHPDSEKFIFRWSENYLRAHYDLVGTADIIGQDRTVYKWYDDARHYRPLSTAILFVFQRR